MSFDFKSLSATPLSQKDRVSTVGQSATPNGGFDFNTLPKSPIELAAQNLYQYGKYTPESFGLPSPTKDVTPQTTWGIIGGTQSNVPTSNAQTTPTTTTQGASLSDKNYIERVAETIDNSIGTFYDTYTQYKDGNTGNIKLVSSALSNASTVLVSPLTASLANVPVVNDIGYALSEGISSGPEGVGKEIAKIPGMQKVLDENPWIVDVAKETSSVGKDVATTALNIAMLLGTVKSGISAVEGGKAILDYKTSPRNPDGTTVTRDASGDVVYIEDKYGSPVYGTKPQNYDLIRLNSSLQNLRDAHKTASDLKEVNNNAAAIKEVITGTKSGQNWWAQNPENEAASQRVSAKVDMSGAVDTTGTVNTKPQQEYFKQTYLDNKENAGYKLLEQEDASVNINRVVEKLYEEFKNTNLPASIVEKAVASAIKKLSTTADELGNIKLVELAKEKSAAQRSANYERTQNNSNAEIKNKTTGRAFRLVVEDVSKTDIAKVNGELSKLYQELTILEKLDGMKVSGGKLGKYFAQISGNIVGGLAGGAIGGPVGAAASAVVGGELASALRGKIMAGKFKKTTPSGETSATISKAIKDVTKTKTIDLKTPDKKVGAPKSVKKTKEIVTLEGKIAKNVEAQKVAIKAKDYTLVAKLKSVYQELVTQLKKAIKYLNENGSVGMSIKKTVTPESVAKRADKADMKVLAKVIDDYDNAILDPIVNRTLSDMGLGKATREEVTRFAKDVFDAKDGVMRDVVGKTSSLEAEAKKYKSAEEFVKAQGTPVYHATSKNFTEFDINKSNTGHGSAKAIFVSESPEATKYYQRGKNAHIIEATISPDAKIFDYKTDKNVIEEFLQSVPEKPSADAISRGFTESPRAIRRDVISSGSWGSIEGKEFQDFLKNKGYDGFRVMDMTGNEALGITNPSKIKTLPQLTDIWKKANKKN